MLRLRDVLEKQNQNNALLYLETKKDSCGLDGMWLSELAGYVQINPNWFINYFEENNNALGIVKCREIVSYNKKKRKIYLLNSLDRLIGRMLAQALEVEIEKHLIENCHSYRENFGLITATTKIRDYILQGNEVLVQIDINKYFENIIHDKLEGQLKNIDLEEQLLRVIKASIKCEIYEDGKRYQNTKGLITGANVSPVLSNYYLNELDKRLLKENYKFIRYGDDYFFLTDTTQKAQRILDNITMSLKREYSLDVNKNKTGIFSVFGKKILGHYFVKTKSEGVIIKKAVKSSKFYSNWNYSSLEKRNNKYYITNDGILTKKDWTILFESEDDKRFLPVEVVDNINVYSNTVFDSNIFEYFNSKKITVNIFDKYGSLVGKFLPTSEIRQANLMFKQVDIYKNEASRLKLARKIQIASLHNMRANLRYYKKKRESQILTDNIAYISESIASMNTAKTINEMMLIEARVRQKYYSCFNEIILDEKFKFTKRTKRPPQDELNALISFGNVVLYNELARIINKSGLDIRISIVHSSNSRNASLNLDIADIFKPILVDRVIFSVINKKQIKADEHFEKIERAGVYLNREGKSIFLKALDEKLNQTIFIKDNIVSYQQLLQNEISYLVKHIKGEDKYKPYKYI